MRSATASACCLARVGEVQARAPGRAAPCPVVGVWPWRTKQDECRAAVGVVARAMIGSPTYRCRPWIRRRARGPPAGRRGGRRCRRLPSPGGVAGAGRPRRSGAAFRDEDYWGRPVPGLRRSRRARVVIVGLAPAAHGANRTGPGVHRRPVRRLPLRRAAPRRLRQPADERAPRRRARACTGAWITAPVRCAPPANKPTPDERDTLPAVPRARAGRCSDAAGVRARSASSATTACAALLGRAAPAARSATASRSTLADGRTLVGSYHVSQQNTFTGKLTEPMLDAVLARARALARL